MADRRMSYWDDTLLNINVSNNGQIVVTLSATPGGLSEGFTVVRSLIHIALAPSILPTNAAEQRVSLGMGLATKEAVAASTVPDPNTNTDAPMGDWMWRQVCLVQ